MRPLDEVDGLAGTIYNAGWMVRNYKRGGRSLIQRAEREQAIRHLGLAVRHAFNTSDDFERLLIALFDALNAKDHEPPF